MEARPTMFFRLKLTWNLWCGQCTFTITDDSLNQRLSIVPIIRSELARENPTLD